MHIKLEAKVKSQGNRQNTKINPLEKSQSSTKGKNHYKIIFHMRPMSTVRFMK